MSVRSAVLAFVALTILPIAPALAEETQEIPAIGAKWTVPDGFTFQEPTADQKRDNYHAVAVNAAIPAQIYLVSETLRDRKLEDIEKDAINVMRGGLFQETIAIKKKQSMLSGMAGFLVLGQGKIDGDRDVYAAAYGGQRKGRFYLMLIVVYYGNHKTAWREIDAAKRGFRVLAEEREDHPAERPWPDLEAGEGEDTEGEDVAPKKPEELWTEKGPKLDKETRTITFPTHNLRWQMPDATPFQVADVTQDESQPLQALIHFVGQVGEAAADILLKVEPRKSVMPGREIVAAPGFQNIVAQELAERLPGRGTVDQEDVIAGQEAGFLMLRGKNEDGNYRAVGYWVFAHGMEVYLIQIIVGGERGCEKEVLPVARTFMGGLSLISNTRPVPGPIAGAVITQYDDRGKFLGKAAVLTADKMQAQKPEFMARLDPEAEGIAFAAEGWNEDRSAYLYVDMAVFAQADLSRSAVTFEEMAQDRADIWMEKAGESASTGKGKKPWKKGKWARAKGIGWEFTGELDGHPFVEHGYILRHKQNAYLVRIQIGGEDGEKKLKKELKALQKGWKWLK